MPSPFLMLLLLILFIACTVCTAANIIPVDWSQGNISLQVSNEDTLIFIYLRTGHTVFRSISLSDYDACTGTEICSRDASPCAIDVSTLSPQQESLYFFSSLGCTAGFKSVFLVAEKTPSPVQAPTRFVETAAATNPPRLALYIQMDHSGSIREANAKCRQESGKDCWNLGVDFVENLINTLADELNGFANLRVYLSYFTCVPRNNKPTHRVASVPSLANSESDVRSSLLRLRDANEERMYGTCPSLGAERIAELGRRNNAGNDTWPKAYYIITDGRVQRSDREEYKLQMQDLRIVFQEASLLTGASTSNTTSSEVVCAMTIGNTALQTDLQSLIESTCIDVVPDFKAIVQQDVALRVAKSLVAMTNPSIGSPGTSAGEAAESSLASYSVVAGATTGGILVIAALALVVFRRRQQQLIVQGPTGTDDKEHQQMVMATME